VAPPGDRPGRLMAKLGSAIGWSYALTAGRVGASTVVTFVLAKLLGPAEFGVVAMAMLFLTIAQTVLQQGLVSAIVQRDQLTGDHLDAAFGVLVLSGLGIGLLTAAASPLWALVNREPQLTVVCLALSPLVLVQALTVVPEAVLRRDLRFRSIAIRTLIAVFASGVVGIVLAVAGAGVWALVAQQLVSAVAGLVVLWAVCPWRPRLTRDLRPIRDLWRFSAHSANAGLGLMLSSKSDQLFTGLFFGPLAVGIYRLAGRLPDMLVDVTVRSLQQVALPALSRLQADRRAFAARLTELQHIGAVVGLPLLGVLVAVAEPLIALLGPQWSGTALPLQLLCLYGATNVYGVLLGPALQAIGKPGRLAAIAWGRGLLGVAVFVVVGLVAAHGTPVRQASAIALAAIGLNLVLTAIAVHTTVRRTVDGSIVDFLVPTLPAVLAALAAAAVAFLPNLGPLASLLVNGAAAGAVAGALLWLTDGRLRTMVRARLARRRIAEPAEQPA